MPYTGFIQHGFLRTSAQSWLNLNLLLTMTNPSSTFSILKGANPFYWSAFFVCMLNEPIPINLTRIVNLHNEGQIKIDTCNPSLYKMLSLFSSKHSADCYLNLCFLCNHWHSNKYFLFMFLFKQLLLKIHVKYEDIKTLKLKWNYI